MYSKILKFILITCSLLCSPCFSQESKYIPEKKPLVLKKLKQWQNIKFGLLMHWGAYSQWGIVESWSLCPEDYGWCSRTKGSNPNNYFEYKREYEELPKTFYPYKFNPKKWAKASKYAGMKYVIFTTKHHDGFCMFDSKYTKYKITNPEYPFSSNPQADVTKEIFNAFREEGFWIGAYFSKPDWHSPYYWDPKYPPKDRNVNYDPKYYPNKWEKFVNFTHNQVIEILSNYGKIDILWLDGGWVAKTNIEEISKWTCNKIKEKGYLKHTIVNQDIKIDDLAKKARKINPELLIVDRAVTGVHQNYLTPENTVPEKTLDFPWESCIISGGGWSHTKNAKYMNPMKAIHLLVDIVAKGGNLLLNIAPTNLGEFQEGAYKLLKEYGDWMKINSQSIYNTKPLYPYKEQNICMTQSLKEDTYYFTYLAERNQKYIPSQIFIKSISPPKQSTIKMLGYDKLLKWKPKDDGFVVFINEELQNNLPCKYAWVIKLQKH